MKPEDIEHVITRLDDDLTRFTKDLAKLEEFHKRQNKLILDLAEAINTLPGIFSDSSKAFLHNNIHTSKFKRLVREVIQTAKSEEP